MERSEVMDIFVPRRPQERLYLMKCDPKAGISNYREVAFLGWQVDSYTTPVGWRGVIHIDERNSAWVVELAEGRFTSPTLGGGVFETIEDVLRLLCERFHQWAESSE
jgi:hypothetical protein